jgi:phosphatidate cytidylyltransferase
MLLAYFAFGALVTQRINSRRTSSPDAARKNWLKYFVYLGIVNLLFAGIAFNKVYFSYLCMIIVAAAFIEIIRLTVTTAKYRTGILSFLFLLPALTGFYLSSYLDITVLFYLLFVVTVFDAFSQLSGQLFGRTYLIPSVSPNKTVEGLAGGILFAILTSVLMRNYAGMTLIISVFAGFGMALSALFGDLSASFIKRKYGVKDFSGAIPGHGGFLDRFDSIIFSGTFLYIMHLTDVL